MSTSPAWARPIPSPAILQRAGVQVLDTKIFVDDIGVVRNIDTAPVDEAYLDAVRRLSTGA